MLNIEQDVKKMLAEKIGLEPEEVKLEDALVDDLGIDSLKVIEIATYIEKTYKIKVKESQMAKIKTVQDVVNVVNESLKETAAAPGSLL